MPTFAKLVNKLNSRGVRVNVDNILYMEDDPDRNSTEIVFAHALTLLVEGRLDDTIVAIGKAERGHP